MPDGWMSFREVAAEVRKQAKCRKPTSTYLLKRLERDAPNGQWLVPDSIRPLRWVDHPTDGIGNSTWALPMLHARMWIDRMVPYYRALQAQWDERRAFKATQKRLLSERFAYLQQVGYDQMNLEWWAERGKEHSEAVRIRRDIDNQLLAKYKSRQHEFTGGQEAKPAPIEPEKMYQVASGPGDERSVMLALKPVSNWPWQHVDITKTLTPHGCRKLVVIHRDPKTLRVFWHEGQEREVYNIFGGTIIPLTKHRTGRYFEGQPTAEQWEKLGV